MTIKPVAAGAPSALSSDPPLLAQCCRKGVRALRVLLGTNHNPVMGFRDIGITAGGI